MSIDRIVLLSGGVDSSTALGWAVQKAEGQTEALFVDYGQHSAEVERDAAKMVADHFKVRLSVHVMTLPYGSPLTTYDQVDDQHAVVPGRNLILIALAGGLADSKGFHRVVIGASDDGYKDQTGGFIGYASCALETGTENEIYLDAPLIGKNVGQLAVRYGVPLDDTWSCYRNPVGRRHCGQCLSCRKREQDFVNAGAAV